MPDWWTPYVQSFVQRVTLLGRATGGIRVTSFLRTISHNREVGGAESSQHLLGIAADLVGPPGLSTAELAGYAKRSGFFGYVLDEGDHVHVQLFPAGAVPQWVFQYVARA